MSLKIEIDLIWARIDLNGEISRKDKLSFGLKNEKYTDSGSNISH
jgi:hypothetical protein